MNGAVRIDAVTSYDDHVAIERAITHAIDADERIATLLSDASRERLIVVKPNWIQESHEYKPHVWVPVITHPGVLLTLMRVLARRIEGPCTIAVCDAPHTYASFPGIMERGDFRKRFDAFSSEYPNLSFELIDLRRETWIRKEEVVVERRPNPEDPRGYVQVDLARDSLFYNHPGEGRYYGADYDSQVVNRHHHGELQEYLIAGTPMACDLFINMPKMKTHKKTGITCCLKNLVGINGDKNWLPHHTEGSPASRGDEFPQMSLGNRIETAAKSWGKKVALGMPIVGTWAYRKMRNAGKQVLGDSETVVRNGNWSGNDTCWRMALDLNRALLYANSDGSWRDAVEPKLYLAIVDGIVGGEGNGPLCPDPVESHVLVSGNNPAHVDAVVATLMGFDPADIPIVANAFADHRWPIATALLDRIEVLDARVGSGSIPLGDVAPAIEGGFTPHFGWTAALCGAV